MNGPANPAPQPHAEPVEQAAPSQTIQNTFPRGKGPTADAPQPLAAPDRLPGWPGRLAWLPIPLLLAAMAVLWMADPRGTYESASLLLVLNFVCSLLASCFIACLVGRSFLVHGTPGLLLLGCGAIAWGAGGTVGVAAGILGAAGGQLEINLLITIHNLCVWLSALCHLAGTVFFSLRPRREMRPAGLWLTAAYMLSLGAAALITLLALAHWLPLFFVQGQGGTPARLFVLGSAIAMFVLSAALLGDLNRRESSRFVRWYALALALIAVGLFGIMIESIHAGPLSWTGRAAQFLGGAYLLIAAMALGRKSGAERLTLAPRPSPGRYRYAVAIAMVAASAALRLALFQSLGTRAAFITFYPAVMLAVLYGGFRSGLLATVLSAAVVNYFWMEPVGHFSIRDPADGLSLAIFLLSCLMISWITDGARRAQARTAQAEAEARLAAERARAAETLRESEEFRSLAEAMPQIVWATRSDGWNIYFNQQWVDYTGMTMEESYGHGWNAPFHPDDKQRAWEAWQRATQHRERYSLECRLRRADGAYRWWLVRGVPMLGANGEILKWFGTCTDIEEIKTAQAALQEANNLLERRVAERTASLQASEHRFRLALQNAPVSVALQDCNLVYQWAYNQRTRRPDEIVGKTDADLFAPEDVARILKVKRRVLASGTEVHDQHWLTSNGKRLFLDLYYEPTRDSTGEITGIGIAVVDLTPQKLAEEALKASEEQLHALADSILNLAWWANADGYITWYNRRWYEYTGTTPRQMEGWGWQSVHDPQALPEVMERWKASIATGQPFEMTFPLRGADGRFRSFLTRIQPLKDAQGHVVQWFGTNTDVEELKRGQEALREAEERLRFALETSHTGAWDLDLVDHTAFRSREHDRVFGYPELLPEWTYEMFLQHVLPEDRAAVDGKFRQATVTQGVWDFECRIRRADGEVRWILAAGRHRTDAAGGKRRMAGIVQDITDRKQAEELLMVSLREKEVLLKEIHHRVKNNLQVISSLVDLQADALKEPALHGVFAEMRDRVRSMALVHEKLYQSESLAHVEFADYTRSLLSYLWRAHANADTAVELQLELEPVSLPVETAVPCGLILNELVTNAFKHAFRGRAKGMVTAALRPGPDGQVCLRVSDDGVGLPTGVDWRQSRSLGLQLVHLLARQLNAIVEVRTGGGTEFLITFEQS